MYLFVWICANVCASGGQKPALSFYDCSTFFLEIVYDYLALSWSGIQYTNQADLDLRD